MERRLTTIVALDVVGYSRLMADDETGTLAHLKASRAELIEPKTAEHNGRVVKLMGDGTLMEFGSVVDAVNFAGDIQSAMAHRQDQRQIMFRIGINIGDIIVEGDDIYGDGVNVASRLEALADPGGICVARSVFDQVKGKVDLEFEDAGEQTVKNIPEPVQVYRARLGEQTPANDVTPDLTVPDKPSIAVLPFDNMSGEAEQDYFADGISEDIITALSKISRLFVIARNSTFAYKGRAVDVKQVAREQGVRYVLEGSVRRHSNRMRTTAQLIEASTGHHLWAQRYDRDVEDIFALQDEMTKEIVSALQVELTEGEQARIAASSTQNVEAWQLTYEGRDLVHLHRKDSVRKGRKLLEQATRLDENYAMAWGALAEAHWKEAANEGWSTSPDESFARAMETSERALELAPGNADLLAMRSLIMVTMRDFDGALAMAREALRLAHSEANAIALATVTLRCCGKAHEALRQTELALRHCPVFPPWYLYNQSICYWMAGDNANAVIAARASSRMDPDFTLPYVALALVCAELDDDEGIRHAVENIRRTDPMFSTDRYLRTRPFSDPEIEARCFELFRKAGLPD